MQRRENDFPSSTKLILAKRVVFLCSRASCSRPTSGPHTDDAKATLIGEAAHITAAAPGGPRFDPSLTSEERRDADNGIWLCAACATEVDKDPDRFPVSLLRKWKLDAEAEALKLLENPTYSKLGISRAPFSPPLDYQRSALEQVVRSLVQSGVSRATVAQLSQVIPNPLLRDGYNPLFEPLSVESVVDALEEMIEAGAVHIDGDALVLNR